MILKEMDQYRFSELSHQLDCYLWFVDYTSKTGTAFYSETMLQLCGYTLQELKKREGGIHALIHADDLLNIKKQITQLEVEKSRETAELVYRIITKENKTVWLKETMQVEKNETGHIQRSLSIASN